MRLLLTLVLAGALVLPAGTAHAQEPLPDQLAAATARATALGLELERAAARDGGLRVALERLEQEREDAQARLDARVRAVWTSRRTDPLAGLTARLSAAGLRRIAHQGAAAAVRVDRELVEDVAARSLAVQDLRRQSASARAGLQEQAAAALEAQERARVLLARVEAQARAPQVAVRAVLDRASAVVTAALVPAQTRRSLTAQVREAPVVALVEAAGAGYPAGWAPTGQVLAGLASWYGPGFVGRPTASGSPYDPERLTCAHRTLRLGTVVRVSANGRSISCLVNDRGPYVGPRILDLSRAGSRALGFDGVQQVVVEVLAPEAAGVSP